MRKIPTIFVRDKHGNITPERHPDCAWVFMGYTPTEKLDGTNVRLTIRAGQVVRVEKRRNPTREQKQIGIIDPWYVDVGAGPEDQYIRAAVAHASTHAWPDGEHCCEAIGPKIAGNTLRLEHPSCYPFDLFPLALESVFNYPTWDVLRNELPRLHSKLNSVVIAEGVVWHHKDGRRAKIKLKDFWK